MVGGGRRPYDLFDPRHSFQAFRFIDVRRVRLGSEKLGHQVVARGLEFVERRLASAALFKVLFQGLQINFVQSTQKIRGQSISVGTLGSVHAILYFSATVRLKARLSKSFDRSVRWGRRLDQCPRFHG